MARSTAFGDLDARRRDACPSAHVPFEAADGALLRVRVPGGSIRASRLRAFAAAAASSSNGIVELTNRANVQLRGFSATAAQAALVLLVDAGLVLADGEADARRNVIGTPLAGLDLSELFDVRSTVHEVEQMLAAWTGPISAKFGVIVDGGGTATLRGRRHDIVLAAVRHEGRVVFEVALGAGLPVGACPSELETALVVEPADAARLVRATLARCDPGERPADLVRRLGRGPVLVLLAADVGPSAQLVPTSTLERPTHSGTAPIGIGAGVDGGYGGWVGAAPVLGRLNAPTVLALADLADTFGTGEVRITPWRSLVIPLRPGADPLAVRRQLDALGMCTDDRGTVLDVIACAGSTGCASGEADAQADAQALLFRLHGASVGPVHVSGCAKRCASRATIGRTLVAEAGRYDVFDGDHRIAERLTPSDAIALAIGRSI